MKPALITCHLKISNVLSYVSDTSTLLSCWQREGRTAAEWNIAIAAFSIILDMIIDVQIWPSAQICTSRGAKGPDLKGQGGITAIVMFKMKEGQFFETLCWSIFKLSSFFQPLNDPHFLCQSKPGSNYMMLLHMYVLLPFRGRAASAQSVLLGRTNCWNQIISLRCADI